MAKKDNNFYFDKFAEGIKTSVEAACLLRDSFDKFDVASMPAQVAKMHEVEHHGDTVKHDIMNRLVKEFLPPIEREDIAELAHIIDNVTDSIEEVLDGIYMYNITALRSEALPFADLIVRCCNALAEAARELPNFRKSELLHNKIVEINALEEEGDRLYTQALRGLYTEEHDPITVLAWNTMFEHLELCCDCCEDVADIMEQIVMKNC